MSEEALQIAGERRDEKGKGERERYNQLNAKFQRTARRDKKAFLNEQCKEIEENNRMEKTRALSRGIGDIKKRNAASATCAWISSEIDTGGQK